MKRFWIVWVICILTLMLPTQVPVHAQTTARVDITARVGFANTYTVARVTPVVLTVTGDRIDRNVRLEWAVTADRGTVVTWSHDVTLPAQSQKQVEFTTIMPGYARSIVARVRDESGILSSTIINAEPASDMLNVVIASDTNLLADLDQTATSSGYLPTVRTVTPQEFPSDIAAFHGIYAVFVADPAQLSPAQQRAIRAWIPLGGRVVFGGALSGDWQDLAAIAIDTSQTLPPSMLPDTWPRTLAVPNAQAIANAVPVTSHEGLLWRRSIGRGDVYQSVLPLAATRGWDEQAWYWQPVSEPTYPMSMSVAAYPSNGGVSEVLASGLTIPALTQLSPLVVFLIVVGYIIVIAPLTYLVLKRRGTLDLAWITIPVTAIVVTGLLVASNWIIRGNDTLIYGLVIVHQDDQTADAMVTSSLAIYTPLRTSIRVQDSNATALIELNTQPTHAITQQGPTSHQSTYTSDIGDINYFMGMSLQPRPLSIQHTLVRSDTTLRGTVTLTGMALRDVVVVADTFSQRIGDVAAGTAFPVSIDTTSSVQFPCDEPNDSNATFNLQRLYTQIAGPCGAVTALPTDRVTIYGWSDVQAPIAQVVDMPTTAQRQLNIVTLVVPTTP